MRPYSRKRSAHRGKWHIPVRGDVERLFVVQPPSFLAEGVKGFGLALP